MTVMFALEFKLPRSRLWHRCSLTMCDREAIEKQAVLLAKQDGWSEWRVVEA